jgi:CRP-like cAMP-binding protein
MPQKEAGARSLGWIDAEGTMMSVNTSAPGIANRMLLGLPKAVRTRLDAHFEAVELVRGTALYRVDDEIKHLYFIERGMVSLVKTMRDGRSVEVAAIGIEGMVGWNAALSADTANFENIVQIPGNALRIGAGVFRRFAEVDDIPRELLHRYSHFIIAQLAQTAACNRLHTLEQRCCRWLLTAQDNARADRFPLTHEFLAMMLGFHRAGVTIAMGQLQGSGLIHYLRGNVTITNRPELESSACECYGTLHAKIDRLTEAGR